MRLMLGEMRKSERTTTLNVDDLPAGIVLSVVALSPLVIIPFAMKFEGERPTIRSIIGSLIAVAGVVVMTSQIAEP